MNRDYEVKTKAGPPDIDGFLTTIVIYSGCEATKFGRRITLEEKEMFAKGVEAERERVRKMQQEKQDT